MKRPAAAEKSLDRIQTWRSICPDITLRSTFIVGFPGETDAEFETLLEFLREAQLDRVGCFQYSPVSGAAANALPDHVPEELKQERWERFMALQQEISSARLQAKVGKTIEILIDETGPEGAIDAPRPMRPTSMAKSTWTELLTSIRVILWKPRSPPPTTTTCGRARQQ